MKNLANYYEKNLKNYSMPKRRMETILSLIGKDLKGQEILDVGCADGSFGKVLEKKGAKIYGLDISKKAIFLAKKKISFVRMVDLNSEGIPFKRNFFDIIIASEIIEHLFDPEKFLKEVRRVLKKDGFFILTTPNFLYWGHRLKFLRGEFEYQQSGPFDRGHIHFYNYQTLLKDFEEAGLNIIDERHIFLGQSFLKFMEKFFPSFFAYQLVVKCQK